MASGESNMVFSINSTCIIMDNNYVNSLNIHVHVTLYLHKAMLRLWDAVYLLLILLFAFPMREIPTSL